MHFLCHNLTKYGVSLQFLNSSIMRIVAIRPIADQLFHVHRRTDEQPSRNQYSPYKNVRSA
jgi:hypothetical protein